MPRYLIGRRAYYEGEDDYGDPIQTANEVIEDDDDPIDTGLVDHNGYSIYRDRERVEFFGFVQHRTKA